MISIIIPAHNEEHVIASTIINLLPGIEKGKIELIVICNGCTDNTVDVVQSFHQVKCIETPIPSKTNALNIGDAAAAGFPRIYLDADVILPLESAYNIAQVLQNGEALAASPVMRMVLDHATWAVRSYYEIWQQLPYVRNGMIGTGVYALSEKGRKRFEQFPEIIADDGFIRALFTEKERISVKNSYSLVRAPATINDLIKIKTRSRLGGYELAEKFPHLLRNEEKRYGAAILTLSGKIRLWPKIGVYLYVNLASRFRARKHLRQHGYHGWERDDSSRIMV